MQHPDDNQPFYLVEVIVPREEMLTLGDLDLQPGMPAEAYIVTGGRTVLSYLVKPRADNLTRSFRE